MEVPAQNGTPPTWKLMLVKWLGLVPVLMAVAYTAEWAAPGWPLWGKLLAETVVVVPTLSYGITPLVNRVFADWLYDGVDGDRPSVHIGS